jgi:hypothetical protein
MPKTKRPRKLHGHFQLPVAAIEFHDGQKTLWVHGQEGGTILRIKCSGEIKVDRCAGGAGIPHSDLMVEGDIHICVPKGVRQSA